MKYDWKHPLPFGDSLWVRKSDIEPLVNAILNILDRYKLERGAPTKNEYVKQVESALIMLIGFEAVEHSVQRIGGTPCRNCGNFVTGEICERCGNRVTANR